MTHIELRYFESCPNWKVAEGRLKEAMLAEGVAEPITYTKVESFEDAERIQFIGSPSILIDGLDPFGPPDAEPGLACRVFATKNGPQGSPTVEELRAVLHRPVS
ncbi:MAG: thioredoxin family protein [Actinobacteria bacterium]|nr:thioredoxin family protein [Actinomycetota bacterium]